MTDLATERLNRTLRVSVIPVSILFLSFLVSFIKLPSFVEVETWIPSVAIAGLGFGLLLSLLTRQSRMTFICINLFLSAWILPYSTRLDQSTAFLLTTFLLIVNLAVFGIQKNRGVFSQFGAISFLILLIEILLVLVTIRYQFNLFEPILNWRVFEYLPFEIFLLSDTILLTCLLVLIILGIQMFMITGHLEAALFWSVIPVVTAANWVHEPRIFFVMFSGTGLMICAGILFHSSDLAFRDELTKLPSRRALEQYLLTLGRHYSIAMVDIDHFKNVNDTYGHDVGDQVLKLIASRLEKVRGAKAFRYGGEEFTLIFPRRDLEEVLPSLERLRKQIKGYKIVLRIPSRIIGKSSKDEKAKRTKGSYNRAGTKTIRVTISIGLASKVVKGQDPADIVTAADTALYRAKKTGRNRTCTHV